jgi:hypothetical protein
VCIHEVLLDLYYQSFKILSILEHIPRWPSRLLRCETQIAKLDLVYSHERWQLRSNEQTIGAIISHATEHSLLNPRRQLGSQPVFCDVIAISQGHVELPSRIEYSEWRIFLNILELKTVQSKMMTKMFFE